VGKQVGETRTYVSESPQILHLFFEKFSVPPNSVILSDNGRSFTEAGVDILLQLGFTQHLHYPAPVHQYLSPNDNKFHGCIQTKMEIHEIGLL